MGTHQHHPNSVFTRNRSFSKWLATPGVLTRFWGMSQNDLEIAFRAGWEARAEAGHQAARAFRRQRGIPEPLHDPIVTVQIGRSTWQGPLSQAPKVSA